MNTFRQKAAVPLLLLAGGLAAGFFYLHLRPTGNAGINAARQAQEPAKITPATLRPAATHSSMPVLLDFYADWCGPCRQLAPVIDRVAEQFRGQVKIVRVNVDEQPELARRFGISGIPTLIVLRDGRPVDQIVGLAPQTEIEQMLQKAAGVRQ